MQYQVKFLGYRCHGSICQDLSVRREVVKQFHLRKKLFELYIDLKIELSYVLITAFDLLTRTLLIFSGQEALLPALVKVRNA